MAVIAGDWQDTTTTQVERPRRRLGLPAPPGWLFPVLAFVAGAALAAAGLVGFWRNEAGRSDAAQALVVRLRHDNSGLTAQVAADAKALRAAKTHATALAAARAKAQVDVRRLSARLVAVADAARKAKASGDAVSASASTLASDLDGLAGYLTQTSVSSLDPNYLATQLAYLKKLAGKLAADAPALSAQLASLSR